MAENRTDRRTAAISRNGSAPVHGALAARRWTEASWRVDLFPQVEEYASSWVWAFTTVSEACEVQPSAARRGCGRCHGLGLRRINMVGAKPRRIAGRRRVVSDMTQRLRCEEVSVSSNFSARRHASAKSERYHRRPPRNTAQKTRVFRCLHLLRLGGGRQQFRPCPIPWTALSE